MLIIALLLAIASVFILPFGMITAVIAIALAIRVLRKKFSALAVVTIIIGVLVCILSIYVFIDFYILDSVVVEIEPEEVESSGIGLFTILVLLITIVLYVISIKPRLIRPGYGSLAFAMLGAIVTFVNPYLALFVVLNSLIFAGSEFYIVNNEIKEARAKFEAGIEPSISLGSDVKKIYRGLSFVAMSMSLFFTGIWLIAAIREILGLNVETIDPVTGESSINANWVFIYLAIWAVCAFFVMTFDVIKEMGPIGALLALLKYLAIGDWTEVVAYDLFNYYDIDNTLVRWLRKYKFFKILFNM